MNSQVLGERASDQKIEKVFHVYGYSIPLGKDGRRLWSTKFTSRSSNNRPPLKRSENLTFAPMVEKTAKSK